MPTQSSILRSNKAKYVIVGGVVFAFNMTLAALAFSAEAAVASSFSRNATNLLVTECSLILAFILHSQVTWSDRNQTGALNRLVTFHAVSLAGLTLRLIIFAIVDGATGNWLLATVSGIAGAVLCNYLGYDSIVFANSEKPAIIACSKENHAS